MRHLIVKCKRHFGKYLVLSKWCSISWIALHLTHCESILVVISNYLYLHCSVFPPFHISHDQQHHKQTPTNIPRSTVCDLSIIIYNPSTYIKVV